MLSQVLLLILDDLHASAIAPRRARVIVKAFYSMRREEKRYSSHSLFDLNAKFTPARLAADERAAIERAGLSSDDECIDSRSRLSTEPAWPE